MGNRIASWPSSSLLLQIPCHRHCTISICCPLGAMLPTKKRKSWPITITPLSATQHKARLASSYFPLVFWQLFELFYSIIIQTIKGAGQVHSEYTRVFTARGTTQPLFYLFVSEWLIVTGSCPASHSVSWNHRHTHTAGRAHGNRASLAVCQGFVKAACVGREDDSGYHAHVLSLCVSLLYVNLHQSLSFVVGVLQAL